MVTKSKNFQRGERQKEVTAKFRDNWDKIFKKACKECNCNKDNCKTNKSRD